jgi:DNA-binding response OmpR family regulator
MKDPGLTVTTVLVVEDDLLVRDLIALTLRRGGHAVHETGKAEAALKFFLANRGIVGLTIIDMLLPGMSGLDLAAELQRQESSVNVLYTSGCVSCLAIESIVIQRPEIFLPKPFTPSQLMDKVNWLLS